MGSAVQKPATLGVTTARKWRHKPLKSLKMDSEMRRLAIAAKKNRSGESRHDTLHASRNGMWASKLSCVFDDAGPLKPELELRACGRHDRTSKIVLQG
jgi:hypothetical protein